MKRKDYIDLLPVIAGIEGNGLTYVVEKFSSTRLTTLSTCRYGIQIARLGLTGLGIS